MTHLRFGFVIVAALLMITLFLILVVVYTINAWETR